MRFLTVLFAVPFVVALAVAQGRPHLRFINPATLSTPTGYTHVVEAKGGRTIYVAGQVALDRTGNVVGAGDFSAQVQQVFENLKLALEAVGATFSDVVKTTTYVTDMSKIQALRDVRSKHLGASPPGNTLVQVVRLARPDLLLEIEAVAVVPE